MKWNLKTGNRTATVVMIDDDQDDFLLVKEAFAENGFHPELVFLSNAAALDDYLFQRGQYAKATQCPLPDLILLDLNMPDKDGFSVLTDLKANPKLKNIPVVILSTSCLTDDIQKSYQLGAESYLSKPDSFVKLVLMVKNLNKYLENKSN